MTPPQTDEFCLRCRAYRQVAVVHDPSLGYYIGKMCMCDGSVERLSRGYWQSFNGADEALEGDEYERL